MVDSKSIDIVDEVIDALKVTTDALTRYRGDVKDSHKKQSQQTEAEIASIERRLHVAKVKLERWNKIWALDGRKDRNASLRYIWDEGPFDRIATDLELLKAIMIDLSQEPILHDRGIRTSKKRNLFRLSTSSHSPQKRKTLEAKVKMAADKVDEICLMSEMAFRAKNISLRTPKLNSSDDAAVKLACEGLGSCSMVFESCSRSQRVCGLSMSRLGPEQSTARRRSHDKQMSYHLFLKSVEYQDLFKADLESQVSTTGDRAIYEPVGLDEQFQDLMQTRIPWHDKADGVVHYEHIFDYQTSAPNLTTTAFGQSSIDDPQHHQMGLISRVVLAKKLAEATFYLIGTPWIATLDGVNIRRVSGKQDEDEYVLTAIDPQSATQQAQHLHLRSLGLLLTELALGRPYDAEAKSDKTDWRNAVKDLTQVERTMGAQYRQAVSFCFESDAGQSISRELADTTGEKEEAKAEQVRPVLENYYEQVLLRLRRIVKELEARS